MSVALRYLSFEEVSLLTERLAGTCRQLGVKNPDDLDKMINAALMPLLIQLEAHRGAETDRRAKLKLVED